jgi:hypothetical protein
MIDKIKMWLLGDVILKKVALKFAKHGITTLAGLVAAKPAIADAGVTIDFTKLESWAVVAIGGLAGSVWNYIQHRFFKKDATATGK